MAAATIAMYVGIDNSGCSKERSMIIHFIAASNISLHELRRSVVVMFDTLPTSFSFVYWLVCVGFFLRLGASIFDWALSVFKRLKRKP